MISDNIDTKKKELNRSKNKLSTEMNAQEESQMLIKQNYIQLKHIIDNLEDKIQNRIDHNEHRLLYAYKNHLQKVQKQLKLLKEQHDANEKKYSNDKEIIHLTKQCTLFRQEAMRLHNQLEDAIDEASVFKRKSEILEKQNLKSDRNAKRLMKSLKEAERYIEILKDQLHKKDENIQGLTRELSTIDIQKSPRENAASKCTNYHIKTQKSERKEDEKIPFMIIADEFSKSEVDESLTLKKRQITAEQDSNIFTNSVIFKQNELKTFRSGSENKKWKSNKKSHTRNISQIPQFFTDKEVQNILEQKEKGKEEKTQQQIKLFQMFIKQIQDARESKVQKFQHHISSKNSLHLLFSDEDLIKLCQNIFYRLNFKTRRTLQGLKFFAQKRKEQKTLTYLSSELMKKFKLKITKDTESQERSQSVLSAGFLTKKKQHSEKFLIPTQNLKKQKKITKLEGSFKKKTIKSFRQKNISYNLKNSQR